MTVSTIPNANHYDRFVDMKQMINISFKFKRKERRLNIECKDLDDLKYMIKKILHENEGSDLISGEFQDLFDE